MSGPNNRPIWGLAVLGGILLIAGIVVFGRGPSFHFRPGWDRENWPVQFQSNGERIYFTGSSSSGFRIGASGGGMHMQMHGGGCVTCHGADRQGGRLMPRFWKVVPPLTPAALFREQDGHGENSKDDGHGDKDDGHGDHGAYDDVTLRRAIIEGVDPGGTPLDREMPRWTMGAQDIADLIAFIKSPVRDTHTSSQ